MSDELRMEVLAPSVIGQIERASIDSQIATARQFPRSLDQFKKRALALATLDKETAESLIYHRPVGFDPETGKQKIAEGESIRMAEIVGASYGNLRVWARVVEQTPRLVRCEGTAHDLESNFAVKSEVVESTVKKNGEVYSERQAAVVVKVCLSKAIRDATFRAIPKSACKFIKLAAISVIRGEAKDITTRRETASKWVAGLGIDPKRVWAAIGVGGPADLNDDHLLTLTGLKSALHEGDITLDEAFPVAVARPVFGPGESDDQIPGADTPPAQQNAPSEPPKRRGRPPGSRNQPQNPAPAPAAAAPQAAPTPAAPPAPPAPARTITLPAESGVNYLKAIKALSHEFSLDLPEVVDHIRKAQGVEETLQTLEEIHFQRPEVLRWAFDNWSEIADTLILAKNPPQQ